MRAVTKDGFRSLLYLISLVVGVATAGVLVGVGFSWLTDPPPATQTAGPILSAQALKENEFRLPRGNGTAGGPLPDIPAEKVAASSLPDAPSNSAALALGMPAMKARHTPSGAITRAKRARVDPHRYQGTPRYWAVLWPPDASAGPNPGGGFYGPPNSTVGYINPR
jgi:hypothetical protein